MRNDNRNAPSNPKADSRLTEQSNAQKDPEDWVTGDEPMTGAQASYLKTLCEETGEAFDHSLTKAKASGMIDALRAKDPRLNAGPKSKGRR